MFRITLSFPVFRRRLQRATLLLACCLGLAGSPVAAFPVSPSTAEIAQFDPLHAAAHKGDLATVEKLIAAKSDIEARDAYGRTPLHVAAYAKRHEGIRALALAGAKLG